MKYLAAYDSVKVHRHRLRHRVLEYLSGYWLALTAVPLPEDENLDNDPFLQRRLHDGRRVLLGRTERDVEEYKKLKSQHESICAARDKNAIRLAAAQDAAEIPENQRRQAKKHFYEIQDAVQRPPHTPFWQWIRSLLLWLCAIVEVPLNEMAMEAVAQTEPWLAWLIAFILGSTLIFFAWGIGLCAKRALVLIHPSELGNYRSDERYALGFRYLIALIIMVGTVSAVGFLISELRQDLLNSLSSGDAPSAATFFSNLPKLVTGQKYIPLGYDGLLLLYANAAFVAIGAYLSYSAHDSVADLETSFDNVQATERANKKSQDLIQKLQQESARLHMIERSAEAKRDTALHAPFLNRRTIGRFILECAGRRKRGYEWKARTALPKGLTPSLDDIEQALATDQEIRQIFPEVEYQSDQIEPQESKGERPWLRAVS